MTSVSLLPSVGLALRSRAAAAAVSGTAARPKISVTNASTVVKDDQVQAAVAALQTQVHRDFAPVWGIDADLTFVASGSRPPAGLWALVILDDSDQADALGYHDLTADGLPLGKVFANSDLKFGTAWTVTASHELLEMLADPDINMTVFVQATNTTGTLFAYEVADACESDASGYTIDDVLVSDFVYPTWFESFHAPGSVQFDYRKLIDQPFGLLSGGYIGTFDVTTGTGWHQQTGEGQPYAYSMRARIGTRRERRRVPRDHWLVSTPGLPRRPGA